MKFLKFILLLLKNGSLKSKPLDFVRRREEVFQNAPVKPKPEQKNAFALIRNWLARGRYTGALIAALAYLKNFKRIHRQYFIVDALQLGYVRIFKTGSTSVLRQLLPCMDRDIENTNLNDKQIDELSNQYVSTLCKKYQKDYTYFTLVRNPFHRIVSAYLDLFDSENTFFSYQAYFFGILKKEMTFSQFVNAISQIPDILKSNHFISQYDVISLCGGMGKVKYFRLEKDGAALKAFLLTYNLNFNQANRSKTEYDYRKYYDQKTLQQVHNMYKADIEMFDYAAEYNLLVDYLQSN